MKGKTLVLLAVLVGAAVALLPKLAVARYAFPSADDFCLAVEARGGFWYMQINMYRTWTGRYSAILFESLVTQWDLARMYPWLSLTTIVATFLSLYALIAAAVDREVTPAQTTVAAAMTTAVFAGGVPSTVEAFYWMPGEASYQWGVIAYFTWLALLIRLLRQHDSAPRIGRRAVITVLACLLPGFNEVLVPIVIATMLAVLVFSRRRGTHTGFLWSLLGLILVLTAVSFLAPGNLNRSSTYPDIPSRHNLAFAVMETARQTLRFIGAYGSHVALWVGACAAWWWAPRGIAHWWGTVEGRRWMAACAAGAVLVLYLTLFPVYWEYGAVNYSGEGRPYNVTYVALCAFVLLVTVGAFEALSARVPAIVGALRARRAGIDLLLAASLSAAVLAAPSTLRALRTLQAAPEYLRSQQARESALRSPANRADVVFVDGLTVKPADLFWGDIQADATHWINACVAQYYRLEAVRSRM